MLGRVGWGLLAPGLLLLSFLLSGLLSLLSGLLCLLLLLVLLRLLLLAGLLLRLLLLLVFLLRLLAGLLLLLAGLVALGAGSLAGWRALGWQRGSGTRWGIKNRLAARLLAAPGRLGLLAGCLGSVGRSG